MRQELWEMLVSCNWNDGAPVRTRHHREWDRQVREITGGLTIYKPAVGQWMHEDRVYRDRMIPVRLMANREQMQRVARITVRHYEQLAVMFYKVSDWCEVYHATEKETARFVR